MTRAQEKRLRAIIGNPPVMKRAEVEKQLREHAALADAMTPAEIEAEVAAVTRVLDDLYGAKK